MMSNNSWNKHYAEGCKRLKKVEQISGVLSVFNANIDAVKIVNTENWNIWLRHASVSKEDILLVEKHEINCKGAFFKGLLDAFSKGIAQEWLITDLSLYHWLKEDVGHDKLQMGGQGGIIANALSLCEVEHVLVHAASLPKEQASLFLDRENLLSVNMDGKLMKACDAIRDCDIPLIHWIFEFKKGDTIELGDTVYTCPKSNRFIATWDPLNFKLTIDNGFVHAVEKVEYPINYCLLAGYQMLTSPLSDGSSPLERILESKKVVQNWQKNQKEMTVHFEFASTQDVTVREMLLSEMGSWVDSIGLNEQELIDLLLIIGEKEIADECLENTHAVPLYKGLEKIFTYTKVKRIQLHLFGLYITLLRGAEEKDAENTRAGMVMAAMVAASKAGSGALESREDLYWAKGQSVSDVSLSELSDLASLLNSLYSVDEEEFVSGGICVHGDMTIVATPTIIVEKPVTLVGMGDTISSLSLIGADKNLAD